MFRTELTIAPAAQLLPRTARVLTLGSCFADSMGARLRENKVTALVNPFGTVFQPLALAKLLRAAAGEETDWQQHLVQARGRWQSYDLHGEIGADSPVELLQRISELVYHTGTALRQADTVVLTLGTAWAYRLRETGELVSNCHKMPADLFVKELLTPDEIINALAETHAYLRRLNPKLRFVLTVSPVRHLKDTLPLNAVSKSVLRVASHYLSELVPDVSYFPAYELLTDDLRDYRFYGADMLHPSPVAEDYVWEKFARSYFDADFGRFRKEWAAVRQSLLHRPLHEGAPEHRHFLEQTRERLERLAGQGVDVGHELADVQQRLAALPEPVALAAPSYEDDGEERIDIGDEADVPRGAVQVAALDEKAAVEDALPFGAAETEATDNEGRSGRLSPEEFRRQRAERGRGGREGRNRRGEPRPERAAEPIAAATPGVTATPDVDADEPAVMPAADLAGGEAPETGKKKKRRSRGGAKRTARKHAARAAAEQGLAIGAGADARQLGQSAAVPTPMPAGAATADGANPAAEAEQAGRRNQRPEARRSSVIAKSVPVKRGGRRGGAVEATPAATVPLAADTAANAATAAIPVVTDSAAVEAPREPQPTPTASAPRPEPTMAEMVLGLVSKVKPNYDAPESAAGAATPGAARGPAKPNGRGGKGRQAGPAITSPVAVAPEVAAAAITPAAAVPVQTEALAAEAPTAKRPRSRGGKGRNKAAKVAAPAGADAGALEAAKSATPVLPAPAAVSVAAVASAVAPVAAPAVAADDAKPAKAASKSAKDRLAKPTKLIKAAPAKAAEAVILPAVAPTPTEAQPAAPKPAARKSAKKLVAAGPTPAPAMAIAVPEVASAPKAAKVAPKAAKPKPAKAAPTAEPAEDNAPVAPDKPAAKKAKETTNKAPAAKAKLAAKVPKKPAAKTK